MAYDQYGDTSYSFGLDDDSSALAASLGLKPQTASESGEPEFIAEARDEDGMVATKVVADDMHTLTLSGFIVDEALFDAATTFTYNDRFYVITGRKKDESNVDFVKGEITATHNPEITS
jgi:hypothetical protein